MQSVINGGIYSVNFKGSKPYEFSGIHPAIVIRTLKEDQMFFCIPLTTYNKDKWNSIRKNGYGCRILSSNSIARIDKIQVVTRDEIKNRWINASTGKIETITPEELQLFSERTAGYLNLSTSKAIKEYDKYLTQYTYVENEIVKTLSKEASIFTILEKEGGVTISARKSYCSLLSIKDVINIVTSIVDSAFNVGSKDGLVTITILKETEVKASATEDESKEETDLTR